MIEFLKKVDIYGVKSELLTSRQAKFTSWLGGLLTLCSFGLFGLMSLLMGRDFWFKTNPRVISNQIMPPQSELIYPNSKNFTILFRTETSDKTKTPDAINPIQPHFSYHHMKKGEDKQWKMMASAYSPGTVCSETAAVENPDLPNLDLNEFRCIDWEEIASSSSHSVEEGEEPYKPVIGGSWEEDEVGFLSVYFSNYNILSETDIKFETEERVVEFLNAGRRFASIYYPESYFDPGSQEKPLNRYWKNMFYSLNSKLQRRDRFFFRINKMFDDIGWILENTQEFYSLSNSEQQSEVLIPEDVDRTDFKRDFYTVLFYVDRSQMEFKRSYMKIQELGAIVGSFMKGVQIIFAFLSASYAGFKKNMFLFGKLNFKEMKPKLQNNLVDIKSVDKSNNCLDPKKKVSLAKNKSEMTYFNYLLTLIKRNGKTSKKYEEIINFNFKLEESLNVENLFKLTDKMHEVDRKLEDLSK